jgi:Protein of unknown function (DUF2281)
LKIIHRKKEIRKPDDACGIYKAGIPCTFASMTLISTIIEPDADGTLHLPLPKAWQHQAIRVRAELEPVGAVRELDCENPSKEFKGFGCLRGKIFFSPDFDEPLEDFKDYTA